MIYVVEITPCEDKSIGEMAEWLQSNAGQKNVDYKMYILSPGCFDQPILSSKYSYIFKVWFVSYEMSVAFKLAWS